MNIWSVLAVNGMDCAMFYALYRLFFKRRFIGWQADVCCLVILLTVNVVKAYFPLPDVLNLFLNLLLSFIAARFLFRGKILDTFLILLLLFALQFTADAAAFGLSLFVLPDYDTPIAHISAVPLFLPLISRAILPPLILCLRRFVRKRIQTGESVGDSGVKFILFVPIPALMCAAVFLYYPLARGIDRPEGLFFLCVTSLIAAMLYVAALTVRLVRENTLKQRIAALEAYGGMTREYMRNFEEAHRDAQGTIHDMRYHLAYLERTAVMREEAKYIGRLDDRLRESMGETGNRDIDAILSAARSGLPEHVTLEVSGRLPSVIPWLDPADMVSLLGNALDNAMEAAAELPAGTAPVIRAAFNFDGYSLALRLENPTIRAPAQVGGSFPSTKKGPGHGLGMTNMRAAAERYGGIFEAKVDGGIFIVRAVLQNHDIKL